LIGSALSAALEAAGHRVVRLVRGGATVVGPSGVEAIDWDPAAARIDATHLEGLDAVVHLAGAGLGDHRWSDSYRRLILDSRVKGTTLLCSALAGLSRPPGVLLSASAIGWYGDRGDDELDESSGAGTGFLADVCAQWEAATATASAAGIRVVNLRTGIVLSRDGGALKKQLPLFKLGLGGRFGSGRQWQSWIAIDDEVGAMLHLLSSSLSGPVNLTAPQPVTSSEFARALGRALHRPAVLPIPSFGPKLVVGSEAADEMLFGSQRVLPHRLLEDGYAFAYPGLSEALAHVLASSPGATR
jgi:uncharacterized protein (TIGR01777 family)